VFVFFIIAIGHSLHTSLSLLKQISSYTSMDAICLHIDIHPGSLTWNLKINPGKGDSFWKPSFSGSMLNFGGVYIHIYALYL